MQRVAPGGYISGVSGNYTGAPQGVSNLNTTAAGYVGATIDSSYGVGAGNYVLYGTTTLPSATNVPAATSMGQGMPVITIDSLAGSLGGLAGGMISGIASIFGSILDGIAGILGAIFGGGAPGASYSGGSYGSGSYGGGSGGSGYPVVLDLSGKGIKITPLSSSNMFFDMKNNGYAQHTAWAGAGNGALVYDPSGGAVTQANQVDFTLWDPAAKTDMQALRDVFDTNHDGVLNASDSSWNNFRILVTNADGTQTLETAAQAGVTSINLNANSYTQAFTDGSSINGETTFTRSNGTVGTAATVTFANDGGSYIVQQTVTHNANGSTTLTNAAYNVDGTLAQTIATTTSADGLSKTTVTSDGSGIVLQTQTDNTVVNGNTTTVASCDCSATWS